MVTFITNFTLKGDAEQFEKLFDTHAAFMASRPGFVGYQMVRSQSNPAKYVNVGQWATAAAHRQVVTDPEFIAHVRAMADLVEVQADLFEQVSAAGVTA